MSTIFSIKASEARGRRLDPRFYHPVFRKNRGRIEACKHSEVKALCDLSNEIWDKEHCFQDHFPYVEIGTINCENGEIGNIEELATVDAPSRAQMVVRAGDLLVSATRPTRNAIAIVPAHVEMAIASTGFLVVRGAESSVVDPRYLFHALRMEFCTKQFDQYSSGGNYPAITKDDFRRMVIPLPPLSEQRKIVAELDAAYAAKRAADEKATKLLASIDDMVLNELGIAKLPKPDTSLSSRIFTVPAKEVLNDRFDAHYNQDFFRDLADLIREDKRCCRLGAAGTFVRGVTYKSEDEVECGHAILRANNVSLEEFDLDLSDLVHVSSDLTFSPGQQIKDGDILICAASGSKEHAGKVAYVRNAPDDTYIGGFMMVLRTAAGVNPEYVATYMQSSIFRGLIFRHLGGTNINNVSLELLNKLPLILPDSAAQKRVADKASSIRAEARKLKADATAALEAAKRKIEKSMVNN